MASPAAAADRYPDTGRTGTLGETPAGPVDAVGPADPAGPLSFADARRRGGVLACNASAAMLDLGDSVLGLEVRSRLGLWDRALAEFAAAAPDLVRRRQFRALLVGTDDADGFAVAGPDGVAAGPGPARAGTLRGDDGRAALDGCLRAGQQALLALRYADFPVVFAAAGPVAGGGLALMLHADAVVAHVSLRAGFCERRFGLLPGWGGIAQMLVRAQALCGDPDAAARLALVLIAGARILDDVQEAQVCGLLGSADPVVADRGQLLPLAKAHALALSRIYARPQAAGIAAAGPAALPALEAEVARLAAAGDLTRAETEAALAAARIIAGGGAVRGTRLSEIDVMRMEREAVLALAGAPRPGLPQTGRPQLGARQIGAADGGTGGRAGPAMEGSRAGRRPPD